MSPHPEPIDLHRAIPGYAPTRLVPLRDAVPGWRGDVVIKLETERFGLPSFKVLGASWAITRRVADWLRIDPLARPSFAGLRSALDGKGRRPTLVAATDGNHGRAVAWTARQIGCRAEIFVPAGTAPARHDAIAGEGASVNVVDGDYDQTVAAAAERSGPNHLLIQDTTVSDVETGVAFVTEGYSTIFDELTARLPDDAPDPLVLVVPVGVGSLAVAAARFLRRRDRPGRLVTVEPMEAASLARSIELGQLVSVPGPHTSCMVGLRCGSISADAWPELRAATDFAVAIEDDEADDVMRWLAARDVIVGECGAAALAAARRLAREGRLEEMLPALDGTLALIATEAPTDPARWEQVVGRTP
ncbi:MAG TPA: pyridoxal-phosphate dependent enzyme [Candidatus Angelobacter sp.]|nr:pyridoxal-phosphate dependent enzyme [Candidatus Angelobacter sp.]